MNIYSIYKITNKVNEKLYIGFTNKIPLKRFQNHCSSAFKNNSQYEIHKALRKYGKFNFVFEILYQSYDNKHTLKVVEKHFIREFNSHYQNGHGYNMTYGGNGSIGYRHSTETKKKISDKLKLISHLKGKTYEEIHGKEKSRQLKNQKLQFFKDRKFSKATKELWSKNRKGKYSLGQNNNAISIILNEKKFSSKKEACIYYNISLYKLNKKL